MPRHRGYGVFPLYPFRKPTWPLQGYKPVLSQWLLEVSHSWLGTTLNWVREERAVLVCMRVPSSAARHPSRHRSTPGMTPPGNVSFLWTKKPTPNPNSSVIYKRAVTWRARDPSSHLYSAFVRALEQWLMAGGTAAAGMWPRVWLQAARVQNHAQQIKLR